MRNSKKVLVGVCACLMASALALSACGVQSTVVKGSNNDGSAGGVATYKTDGTKYTSAVNCGIAYNSALENLLDSGYTNDNVKKFYQEIAALMPLDDLGTTVEAVADSGAKYEAANNVFKPYVEPVKYCSGYYCWVQTGRLPLDELAAVQEAYKAKGGKATITAANKVRPDFGYTFKEAYDGNAAGSTVYKNTFIEGQYFIEIDGQWYLFDKNL